jgi:hypothetical protein
MYDLNQLFAGVDLDSLGPELDPGLMRLYQPEDAGPLDAQGIPDWFPQTQPLTGAPLTPPERQMWFQEVFDNMNLELEEEPSAPSVTNSPPFDQAPIPSFVPASSANGSSRKQQRAALNTLLLIKYALTNDFLPTPAQS